MAALTITSAPLAPVAAPPVRPAGYGLLAAATVVDLTGVEADRVGMFGVEWDPLPCKPALPWPAPCNGITPPPAGKTIYDRPERVESAPLPLYWAEECAPVGIDIGEPEARVRAGMAQGEGRGIEAALWSYFTTLVIGDDDLGLGRGLIDAVGHLEEELGNRIGALGILHAPRRTAAHAAAAGLVRYDGAVPRTPAGHAWVFGAGYDPAVGNPPTDGVRIVATGPTTLRRTPVQVIGPVFDQTHNRTVVVAERVYTAAWDCAAVSMTLPLSA